MPPAPQLPSAPPLVVLMGVAGCGKTTIGRLLAAALGVPFCEGDDLHSPANRERMQQGQPLDDAQRWPWLDAISLRLAEAAKGRTGLVAACSALKDSYRRRLAAGLHDVVFVFLDADRATLQARLAQRQGHFFGPALLDSQLQTLQRPTTALTIDATRPPPQIVAALREHLAARARPARLVDGTALPVYDLGTDHVFARDRLHALFDLLRETGLVAAPDLLATHAATDAELATVHEPAYIECLRTTSLTHPSDAALAEAQQFGLGTLDNPLARGQHAAAAAAAGATLTCIDAVLDGTCRAAFNPAGGLHHAMPHGAAGFCLYNDIAIGIRRARQRGCERVLYVDFDVHHGDGVEWTFRRDPNVLTLSFHETPEVRYPGTGFLHDLGEGEGAGYALNVPLQPGTADASWLDCVERVLGAAVRGFRPDLIVSQHGCDTHREDPLATLECTTRAARGAAELTCALAFAHCHGRWVATGGGGYQPLRVIPRAWAMVWSAMSRRPLPDQVPAAWLARWERKAGGALPAQWLDAEERHERHDRAAARNRQTVDELFAAVPWLANASRPKTKWPAP